VTIVSPEAAIGTDTIVCLVCGGAYRHLTNTHLGSHGLTTSAYKERFGYAREQALQCGALRARKQALATAQNEAERAKRRARLRASARLVRSAGPRAARRPSTFLTIDAPPLSRCDAAVDRGTPIRSGTARAAASRDARTPPRTFALTHPG
jgi:hypothetical protein